MGKLTFLEKLDSLVRHLLFKLSLPVYLYSIREKSLENYLTSVEKMYEPRLLEDFAVFVNEYNGNSASLRVLVQQFIRSKEKHRV